jgi:hypothetical protein
MTMTMAMLYQQQRVHRTIRNGDFFLTSRRRIFYNDGGRPTHNARHSQLWGFNHGNQHLPPRQQQQQQQQQCSIARISINNNNNNFVSSILTGYHQQYPEKLLRGITTAMIQIRSFSSKPNSSSNSTSSSSMIWEYSTCTIEDEQLGAWAIIAALEKVKEKQAIHVAKLVSSLQAILPPPTTTTATTAFDSDHQHAARTFDLDVITATTAADDYDNVDSVTDPYEQHHSTDPAFLYIPGVEEMIRSHQLNSDIIKQLLDVTLHGKRIDIRTVTSFIKAATNHYRSRKRRVLQQQKLLRLGQPQQQYHQGDTMIVRLPPLQHHQQLVVVGDLHGSLSDLAAVLGLAMTGTSASEPNSNNMILFNGDLADRGDHGIEIIAVICALVLTYPDYVYLNRGNHEDIALSVAYGLAAEIQHKYGSTAFRNTLCPLLDDFFQSLPLATIVDKDALIVHAGPPPPGIRLKDVSQYFTTKSSSMSGGGGKDRSNTIVSIGLSRTIRTTTSSTITTETKNDHDGPNNHDQTLPDNLIQAQEIIESMLWSDPDIDDCGTALVDHEDGKPKDSNHFNYHWEPNVSRGAGYKYDAAVVRDLLQSEGLSRMIRSHEPVHMGCARYTVEATMNHPPLSTLSSTTKSSSSATSPAKPLEFFTVFSASRYPHKEGFNQGAILKLKSNGRHSVVRFATEEDEPLIDPSFTSFGEDMCTSPPTSALCKVDLPSIRRSLKEVAAPNRIQLIQALQQEAEVTQHRQPPDDDGPTGTETTPHGMQQQQQLPLDTILDILIDTLELEKKEKGVRKVGARLALAKAILNQSQDVTERLPESVDIQVCIDAISIGEEYLLSSEEEDNNTADNEQVRQMNVPLEMLPFYPWLKAVFEVVDVNHDGVLSKEEWLAAVDMINSKLPQGVERVHAEDSWNLLDVYGHGEVSAIEWDRLGKILCRL